MIRSETLQLPISYRYDLVIPEEPAPLLVALHGYGQNKEVALRFAQQVQRRTQRDWTLAALQAPHPHHIYKEDGLGAGFSWVSAFEPAEDVRNHHRFLSHVIARAYNEGWTDRPSAFLFGFSQSVSLNYRFAAAHPERVRGVVAVAGATPSDWAKDEAVSLSPPALHVAPTEDEAYPLERARAFRAQLDAKGDDVTWSELPGKHRVPSAAYPLIARWLEERLARGS